MSKVSLYVKTMSSTCCKAGHAQILILPLHELYIALELQKLNNSSNKHVT